MEDDDDRRKEGREAALCVRASLSATLSYAECITRFVCIRACCRARITVYRCANGATQLPRISMRAGRRTRSRQRERREGLRGFDARTRRCLRK